MNRAVPKPLRSDGLQFLELFQAFAGRIGFGFDLHREDIIVPLDQEIYLYERIALAQYPGAVSNWAINVRRSLAQTSDNRTLALSAVFAAAVTVIPLTVTHLVFRKTEIK